MKDYAVKIKVQNNFLLERMRAAGFETVAALAKAAGVNQQSIGNLLNLKTSGLNSREHWRAPILKLCECLRCLPEDIIPIQHHRSALAKNTASVTLDSDEVEGLFLAGNPADVLADTNLKRSEALNIIAEALGTLSPRAERILRLRFGLDGGEAKTLAEVGEKFSVTSARVQQIENTAIRRLKSLPKNRALFRDMPELLRDI